MVDVIVAVANLRHMSERRVVNDYTYRQILKIGEIHLKDKFMVLRTVSKMLGDGLGKSGKKGSQSSRKLPRRRSRCADDRSYRVDLDGPLGTLRAAAGLPPGTRGKEHFLPDKPPPRRHKGKRRKR